MKEIQIRATKLCFEPISDKQFGSFSENDSKEEAYFDWWASEAIRHGLLKGVYLPESVVILDAVKQHSHVQLKKQTTWKTKNALGQVTYTPDRVLEWTEKARNVLFKQYYVGDDDQMTLPLESHDDAYFYAIKYGDSCWSVIDIKPSFVGNHNTSGITFPLKQHSFLTRLGLYCQKVKLYPGGKKKASRLHLFPHTFTPLKYVRTDGGSQIRKIHFEIKSVKTLLNGVR